MDGFNETLESAWILNRLNLPIYLNLKSNTLLQTADNAQTVEIPEVEVATMVLVTAAVVVTVAAVEAMGATVAADEAVAAVAVATVVAETATAVDALGSEQEIEVVVVKILAPMIAVQAAHRKATGAKHEDNPTNLRINLAKASVEAKQIEATTNQPRADTKAAETAARIEFTNFHSSSLTVAGGENTP